MDNEITKNALKCNRTLYLDVTRVFAIVCITLNHAVNRTYDNYTNQYGEFLEASTFSTFIKTFISVLSRIGVPLFLMITGVLILNKCFDNADNIRKFIKNNYLKLLITTEIWIFIMFWFIVLIFPQNIVLENEGFGGACIKVIKCMFFTDWTTSGVSQTCFGSMWYMPMILCLYPLLPFLSILIKKYSGKILIIPTVVTYLFFMFLPLVNQQLKFMGEPTITPYLKSYNLPSYFLIYIVIGYFIGQGFLNKLKDYQVFLLAVLFFTICCSYQWYAYSQPLNYLIDYNFPLLPITASFIFDFIRRKENWFKGLAPIFTYISRISFAIYFVHILIMDGINFNYDLDFMRYPIKLLFLETVSVLGSIVIIAVLSKIKFFKKYLFMYK